MKYSGIVIRGLQNGRKFGFPTANVRLEHTLSIDKGVYAVKLEVIGRTYKGMLYVGTRPTLDLSELSFEINILDFHRNIYDEILSFDIIEKIRDEVRFDNTNALIEQLKKDRKAVRAVLANPRRRLARKEDVDQILSIIDQAKRRLKELNVDQWQDGYPDKAALFTDIRLKQGHVFVKNNEIVAYAALIFTPDLNYAHIDGEWLTNDPYLVLHRLAVCDALAHTGIARYIFAQAIKLATRKGFTSFRVDTHPSNHYMRNLIRMNSFTLCGIVQVRGEKRMAYEKKL